MKVIMARGIKACMNCLHIYDRESGEDNLDDNSAGKAV